MSKHFKLLSNMLLTALEPLEPWKMSIAPLFTQLPPLDVYKSASSTVNVNIRVIFYAYMSYSCDKEKIRLTVAF